MVSGSDDFTMILWQPSTSKQPVARMTGHVQLINQVGRLLGGVCGVGWDGVGGGSGVGGEYGGRHGGKLGETGGRSLGQLHM